MDKLDRKILSIVQGNNRKTAEEISQEAGLSPAAVQRRLVKLRSKGVIAADVSVLSPAAVGREVTLVVGVTLERERVDLITDFEEQMRRLPEVQQCYYVTGDYDYILVVTAKDMNDYEEFTRRELFDNRNIRRFHTSAVMKRIKASLFVPVLEEDVE